MNAPSSQVEAYLQRLSSRLPDLPVTEVLLTRLIVHLGRNLSAMLDQRIRPHGLNEVEFRTLMSVFSHGQEPVYPSDLCSGVAQSPANITRITDALVSRGLISRVPNETDRRRLVLRVTDKGEALVRELMPTVSAPLLQLFGNLTDTEKDQLAVTLKSLADAISALTKNEEPAP